MLQLLAVVCIPLVLGVLGIPAAEDSFVDVRVCKFQAVA